MLMPVKFTAKVAKVGHSLKVTVPKELAECDTIKLKKGDPVFVWEEAGRIIIEKKKSA
jgi:bifunctional DNA-binding transcriptional regulator/antitoxin component of YhaV-PrlF toxin-antitoxin module